MKIMENGIQIGEYDIFNEKDGIYLANFTIYKKYRMRGYGEKSLRRIIKDYGVDTLICAKRNSRALHIYKKAGFFAKYEYFSGEMGEKVFYMKR